METLLAHVTAAHRRLDELHSEEKEMLEIRVSEAQWFRKIDATALGVRPVIRKKEERSECEESGFLALVSSKHCWLGSAHLPPEFLFAVLKLYGLGVALPLLPVIPCDFPKDPTDTILLLYEFEASAKLNSPAVPSLLDEVVALPQVEIKTLETIAALAMESPAHYPSVCKRALKMVLTLLRKGESMDTITYSKCLHSLVQLSLPSGPIEADLCVLEEAWAYFEDALTILDNTVSITRLLSVTGLLRVC
ncbi:testis-expressed sequence 11 protein [Crotalus adamanteus]|uniref:Testis-expressed sequence 11 protein n=1 Tax=Crotalus adamanteus TaxID=8729 RepID=A0AAW1AVP7_CROAD